MKAPMKKGRPDARHVASLAGFGQLERRCGGVGGAVSAWKFHGQVLEDLGIRLAVCSKCLATAVGGVGGAASYMTCGWAMTRGLRSERFVCAVFNAALGVPQRPRLDWPVVEGVVRALGWL